MRAVTCLFWVPVLCAALYAENFYIAVAPFVLKGVTREQSVKITDAFIKTYNQTALYKLMTRENMEPLLSKEFLNRSSEFSEIAYNLATARTLSVQYLLSGVIEQTPNRNTIAINIFDLKAQLSIKTYTETGKDPAEKLALKMIPPMVSGIDEILSNDRVVLSLVEAEKKAAQVVKPVAPVAVNPLAEEKVTRKKWSFLKKIKSETNDTLKSADNVSEKRAAVITPASAKPKSATDFQQQLAEEESQQQQDSLAVAKAEKKQLEDAEKSRREQALAFAETEKKRLKAEKKFEESNKNRPAAESTEKPFLKKKAEPDASTEKQPAIVQDKPVDGPQTATVITPIAPAPASPAITPDAQPEKKTDNSTSIDQVKAEQKRLKEEEKFKRKQAAILAQTEKKRLKAQQEFDHNQKTLTATETTEAPLTNEQKTEAKPEKNYPAKKETPIATSTPTIHTEPTTGQTIHAPAADLPQTSAATKAIDTVGSARAEAVKPIVTAPEIKTEEKPGKHDSLAQVRAEKKRLKKEEKYNRKQAAILAETEKKRALAEKEFALNKTKITGTEATQEPQSPEVKTPAAPEKKALPPKQEKQIETVATDSKPDSHLEQKTETQNNRETPAVQNIPASTPVASATPSAPVKKPEVVSPKPGYAGRTLDRREAAAMARAERKKMKATEKMKRTEVSAMVKAEKTGTARQKNSAGAPNEKKRRTTVITSIVAGTGVIASIPLIMYFGSKSESDEPANESFFLDIIW